MSAPLKVPISIAFQNEKMPEWLPSAEEVVQKCREYGYGPASFTLYEAGGPNLAFVKYGPAVGMSEARNQNYIATHVNADENPVVRAPEVYYAFRHSWKGYIVMEHVGDTDCDEADFSAICIAVDRLQRIPSPTSAPGPVGGGPITHRFFADCRSDLCYDSVDVLQDQVNGVLARGGLTSRIKFPEAENGQLFICFDDLHWQNFRKDKNGVIYAVDHANVNFLPLAFRYLSLHQGRPLAQDLLEPLGPASERDRAGMLYYANGRLNLFDDNTYGLPAALRKTLSSFDPYK